MSVRHRPTESFPASNEHVSAKQMILISRSVFVCVSVLLCVLFCFMRCVSVSVCLCVCVCAYVSVFVCMSVLFSHQAMGTPKSKRPAHVTALH